MEYIKVPHHIEEQSMQIINEILPHLAQLPVGEANVIRRVVHTTGDPEFAQLVKISSDAVSSGINALKSGCSVITDVNMVKVGINSRNLSRLGGQVDCFISHPDVIAQAKASGSTRAIESVNYALDRLDGAIIAVGNAPTALFRLCELVRSGAIRPALIVGTPVGFVGAKESKEFLVDTPVPYITVTGSKGGSTIAAAVVNALLYTINNDRGL